MKVFIDTSSLFKKYHLEPGTDKLFNELKHVTEIFVSPITHLEIINTAHRLYHEKRIKKSDLDILSQQVNTDFPHFTIVAWDNDLEDSFFHWAHLYKIKSLDIIQLSAAKQTKCNRIITSDKNQYQIAKREFEDVLFV